MYRRKRKTGSNSLQSSLSTGSDIAAPNNTSLLVNRSKVTDDSPDDLPKSVTAALYDDDESSTIGLARPSTSILQSMTEKKQSTPNQSRVLQDTTNIKSELFSERSLSQPRAQIKSSQPLCFFREVLSQCGVDELVGQESFRLSQDQALVSRALCQKIKDEGIVDKFMDAMKSYIEKNDNMKKMLLLTQTSTECDAARGPVQQPLLRILLLVDCLQSKILDSLLTKIAEIIADEKMVDIDAATFVSAILKQVRYLTYVESSKFTSKLFALMPVAPSIIQQEIVFLLPDLIMNDEIPELSTKLADILQPGNHLTPIIINALSCLPLSADLNAQVRGTLLSYLPDFTPAYVPSLVHFILKQSDPLDMNAIVQALRENLVGSLSRMEPHSSKKMFKNLNNFFIATKSFTDAWIKAFTNATDVTCLDLMALILIHGHIPSRKPSILTLLRNRIRSGVITTQLFTETFQILKDVILVYQKEVLELSSLLLKSFEQAVSDVAKAMLTALFEIGGPFLRIDIVRSLIAHLTTGAACAVQNAISLLINLRVAHADKLEAHVHLLMSALKVLPEIDLSLARQFIDVVASLVTLPAQESSGLLEELQIFIRKLMLAWQPDKRRRGIMATVTLVKHCALQAAQTDCDMSESDFLLKMAAGNPSAPATVRGFFFDELATALRETNTNSVPFLMSWANRIFNQVSNDVFVTDIDLECEHFPMSPEFSIDNAGSLVLPVVTFVVNPKPDGYLKSETIPAALRLLWCAEKDMKRISSMLTASVVLPDSSVYEKFLTYSPAVQKMIMDCLFLCANYFIECINALSTQKSGEQLVIRVKQLMEVRKLILQHVGQIPEYVPPISQFHIPVAKVAAKKPSNGKKPARGRKRKSDGQDANQSHLDATALPSTSTAAPAEAVAQLATPEDFSGLNLTGAFRELHCHVFKLFRMELKLNPTKVFKKKKMSDLMVVDVSWSYRPEDKPELGPSDTLFLLQDYLTKSDLVLRDRPWFLTKKPTGLVVEGITPQNFVNGTVKLLPKLCLKLDVVSSYCRDLLEANDGIWDAPGCFPTGAADIKSCFCALLKIFADLLAWRGLQNPANASILKEIVMVLSRKTNQCTNENTAWLALEAARFLANLGGVVPLLSGGVHLTRAVQACLQFTGSEDFSLAGDLCCELLKRPWFTLTGSADRGAGYNQQVDCIVRMYLACADNRLQNIQRVAVICLEEVPNLLTKDSTLATFPALNKANFPLLYRGLCEALVSASAEELTKNKLNDEKCIEVWTQVINTLLTLAEISKVHSARTNLSALLKRSQAIIQLFLSKGLPVMDSALRIKSDEVFKILKTLQIVTRFLHSVCCHSKMNSDTVIAAHVPKIRALCESITLEVKGMIILNKLPSECIDIAVLKNRDIQGNAILSQSTVATSDDESELPDEEVELLEDEDIPDDGF